MTAIFDTTLFSDDSLAALDPQLLSAGSAALFEQYEATAPALDATSQAEDAYDNLYPVPC